MGEAQPEQARPGRTEALVTELKQIIRRATRDRDGLIGELQELSRFAQVQAAGDLGEDERLNVILHALIPNYLTRLPDGSNGRAIRELLSWDDEHGEPQSLTTRYHKAAKHILSAPKDFGRRKEPMLLHECARYFIRFDYEDRASPFAPHVPVAASQAPIVSAGIVDVHPSLDYERLIEQMPGAITIEILNTWIPDLSSLVHPLSEALAGGAVVRILMLHPESRAAEMRSTGLTGSPEAEFYAGEVRLNIRHSLDLLAKTVAHLLDARSRARLKVRLYDSLPSLAVYSVDDRALASVFFHGKLAVRSPQIEVHGRKSLMGSAVFDEFRTLWRLAADCEIEDITRWREQIGTSNDDVDAAEERT
jgi:hypothetical protein